VGGFVLKVAQTLREIVLIYIAAIKRKSRLGTNQALEME
jgi:hypothetical protein